MSTEETTAALPPSPPPDSPAPAEPAAAPAAAATEKPASRAPSSRNRAPASSSAAPKAAPASAGPKKGKTVATARPRASNGAAGGSKKAGGASAAADADKKISVGDIVLGRLRGYPPWPARISDIDDLPADVLSQRPGKSPSIYCVQFFDKGDYSWLKSSEISHLTREAIKQFLEGGHRKAAGNLRGAYETALDPTEWDASQAEARRLREEAAGEVDELADEEEDEEAASGGKRKASGDKKGKAKKAKTVKKSAAEVEEEEDDAPKSKAAKGGKADKKATQSKPKPVPNQPPADDDPLANNPECIKVKDWRHKLQRAFLGKGLPAAGEMDGYDSMFTEIENYKDITIEALQYSKIGKVMKKIATLDGIPRNDELKITDRASKLMQDWQNFIAANESKTGSSETKANGANGESDAKPAGEAADAKNPPTPPAETDSKPAEGASEEKVEGEGKQPEQSEADPAVNGTGDAEGEDVKMD